MLDDQAIDRRYLWGVAGIVGVGLLVAVFWSGGRTPSDSPIAPAPPVTVTAVEIADAPGGAEELSVEEVQIAAAPVAVQEDAAAPPSSGSDEREGAGDVLPLAAGQEDRLSQAPPVAGAAATVPVLKSRDVKIKKQQAAVPAPVEPAAGERSEVRSMEPFAQRETVDVSGLTLSFEEQAESYNRRRNILMLHTRAEEALSQGRLLEPAQNSAYRYYRQILELDPDDARARDGLRLIGDKYAAVAETALNGQEFDQAAAYVADGFKAMPDYPILVALDERIRRERDERIHDLSEKARLCLDADKLSSPADDSAYFYYGEVLRLDPENSQARKGYTAIADRYAQLAEQAFLDLQFADAERFVRRGLQVVPNHYYLLSLQQELQRSDLEKVGHSVKKRINKLFSN